MVSRGRSFSTTVNPKIQMVPEPVSHAADVASLRRKKSVPSSKTDNRDSSGGSAEEFFMDVMVQRHARRLLCDHRLGDLGRLAAHLDFPLVAWLARERDRAARVDGFVQALKDVHADFNWPYPQLAATAGRKTSSVSVSSSMSSPSLDDRLRGLTLDLPAPVLGSRVGDSGYMSQDHPHPLANNAPFQLPLHAADERSIVSEEESWLCGDDSEQCTSDSWSDIPSAQLLDQIAQEVSASKGSTKAEVQLRYLLQLLMEAGCLEWALIVGVTLRDVMAVHRVTNAARSLDLSHEALQRLREGLMSLYVWSCSQCLGYKPFMTAVHGQVLVLNKLLSGKQPPVATAAAAQPPPAPAQPPLPRPRSRTASSSLEADLTADASASDTTIAEVEGGSAEPGLGRTSPTLSQASSQTESSSCVIS